MLSGSICDAQCQMWWNGISSVQFHSGKFAKFAFQRQNFFHFWVNLKTNE
jgi:hypothetical protein